MSTNYLQEKGRMDSRSSASSSTISFNELLASEKQSKKPTTTHTGHERAASLKLFESPLAHERKRNSNAELTPQQPEFIISGPTSLANQNISRERLASNPNIYDQRTQDGLYKDRKDSEYMRETPEFKRYEEATNIELFYDLFFVANLTTFTDVHEINEVKALKAYAGFFCILWFLWAQVALFDVRFVQDSILERVGKICQFGVMVGLAILGPDFNPSNQNQSTFRSLAIVLMISRVLLGFQYSLVLREVWYYKNTKVPLLLIVGTNFLAALVYFGTFFGFKPHTPQSNVFVVWYVTAILETIINIAVSSKWEVLTFAGTHLIKRMSLLTLIILGEGIIAVSKSIAKISEQEEVWTGPLLGTIIAAVLIIYFIYMIYFDWLNREHFSSLLEGLWAILHFPFHLALVLLVEGTAQFILWRKVVEVVRQVNNLFLSAERQFTGTDSLSLSQLFANVTNVVFKHFQPGFTRTLEDAQKSIYRIGNETFNSTGQLKEISTLFAVIQDSLFDNFGIEPPESAVMSTDPNEEWSKNMDAFTLIFIYFFVSAGLTLLLLSSLNFLSIPADTLKTKIFYARTFINFAIGLVLCGLAGIVNTQVGFEFAESAWILPTVAFSLWVVVLGGYAVVGKRKKGGA